ncbi:BTB/POZ and MATH domain-containing protein 1-like [Trifolium pratense]|uniref:BTB/POZ and MATH domain-containing protein 1-like n=1 Tax=Trifolium pratense TaxID=57577 RepID=UPI001E696756|nr:BTB/POZ and MATH domain-containing protein 1-like [Trifolium pratense]
MMSSDLETTSNKAISSAHNGVGISISKRDLPPADYLFKIDPYPSSMDKLGEKYESDAFQVGDYTWKLVLYPSGKSKRSSKDHVSLYLAIVNTENLSRGWEVNVNFKLFVLDQYNNNYLTIQDGDGAVRKFSEMKSEWGFEKLISLDELFDSSNGYFVEDTCVFGAEVFVIRHCDKWETLYLVNDPPQVSLTWKLDKFSFWTAEGTSKPFTVGEREWMLKVLPRGYDAEGFRGYLALILQLTDWKKFPSKKAVNASVKIKILDQLNNKNYEKTENFSFSASQTDQGDYKFIYLSDLKQEANGYIKDDVVILEVEIFKISII